MTENHLPVGASLYNTRNELNEMPDKIAFNLVKAASFLLQHLSW